MAAGKRLGFLIPPGNPTVEPEMARLCPPGASVHFNRMVAGGATGSLDGQEERNRSQLAHLGVRRIALGAPYAEDMTRRGREHLEAHGLEVAGCARLPGVVNIYDETPERARELALLADAPGAQAVVLSGVGLPTVTMLDDLERELGKPVVSSAAAMMWNALRVSRAAGPVRGFGSLLEGAR